MARTAQIRLDESDYTVHPFNIGELETITDAMASTPNRVPLLTLRIALARANPPVGPEAAMLLEPTSEQVVEAVRAIMKLSGMEIAQNPPA